MKTPIQDLSQFKVNPAFRGRPAWFVQLWWLAQACLVHPTPQALYGWRRLVLRCFGAKIGKGVILRPSVRITYPWKVTIGDNAWVGDRAELYSLAPISIGANAVVSQDCYLCAGTHDYTMPSFDLVGKPIVIAPQAWVAAGAFVAPGVTVGEGAIVGARAVVLSDVPPAKIVVGNPAKAIKSRVTKSRR